MFKELYDYWKTDRNPDGTGIHPCDEDIVNYLHKQPSNNNYRIHDNLFPEPYNGSISNPKIVFLYLNPGYHIKDDEIIKCKRMKNEFKENLNQSFSTDYPFFWLNPDFKNHSKNENPGAYYWNRLFDQKKHSFLEKLAIDFFDSNKDEARKWLANNVCDIELFPYHSVKFKASWANSFSAEMARKAVFGEIESAIESSKKVLFVIMRSKNLWIDGCKKIEDIIARGCKEKIVIINKSVQNPSLNPNLELGKKLLEFIKIAI